MDRRDLPAAPAVPEIPTTWRTSLQREPRKPATRYSTSMLPHQVKPCLGCNHCGMEGPCVHQDDFTKILRPELEKADMVVFCSPMYYFGFSAQIKTVIDRFYALNGTLHSPRKTAFLMAYANMSAKDAEAMTAHYKTIADYMGWEDVGSVIAPGIWTAGSIKGTKYATQAYESGKSLQ